MVAAKRCMQVERCARCRSHKAVFMLLCDDSISACRQVVRDIRFHCDFPDFVASRNVVVFGVIAYSLTLMFSETTGFSQKALYAFTIYCANDTPSLVAALIWERATK